MEKILSGVFLISLLVTLIILPTAFAKDNNISENQDEKLFPLKIDNEESAKPSWAFEDAYAVWDIDSTGPEENIPENAEIRVEILSVKENYATVHIEGYNIDNKSWENTTENWYFDEFGSSGIEMLFLPSSILRNLENNEPILIEKITPEAWGKSIETTELGEINCWNMVIFSNSRIYSAWSKNSGILVKENITIIDPSTGDKTTILVTIRKTNISLSSIKEGKEPIFSFEPILIFGSLAVFLLIGVVLRAKVGFFQKYLIPACLIGGTLALILRNAGLISMSHSTLKTFVYHFFNISFISLGLTPSAESEETEKGKERVKSQAGMGLLEGTIFPLQLIIGGLLTLLFVKIGFNLFSTFGFLSPLGFIEGPGQALSIGQAWAEATSTGALFAHAATVGLTFATIGFFFAFFVGVPLVNWGVRKGLSSHAPPKLPEDFRKGITSRDQEKEVGGRLTTHSANIDSLAFQVALIGLAFILTFGLVKLLAGFFSVDLAKTLWGFFFFFGLVVAMGLRWLINQIGFGYLIDRNLQKRISGWAVDFLIISTIAAIEIAIVWKFIVPILTISLTSGVLTLIVVFYLGKRIWSSYNLERTAGVFGTVTGTVPTGLLLIRIADPEFQTPAAVDLGVMMIFAAPFIFLSMMLVNAPVLWGWSLERTLLIFAAMMGVALALFKILGLWGEPQY